LISEERGREVGGYAGKQGAGSRGTVVQTRGEHEKERGLVKGCFGSGRDFLMHAKVCGDEGEPQRAKTERGVFRKGATNFRMRGGHREKTKTREKEKKGKRVRLATRPDAEHKENMQRKVNKRGGKEGKRHHRVELTLKKGQKGNRG